MLRNLSVSLPPYTKFSLQWTADLNAKALPFFFFFTATVPSPREPDEADVITPSTKRN